MLDQPDRPRTHDGREPGLAGAAAIALSAVAWWPAFTLGAWGQVFFEQILALWASATAACIVVLVKSPRRTPSLLTAALLLPSVWLVLAWLVPGGDSRAAQAVPVLDIALTVIGIPAMGILLVRIAMPSIPRGTTAGERRLLFAAVAAVAAIAFLLGLGQSHFLTRGDFARSGNALPEQCTPGPATLGR